MSHVFAIVYDGPDAARRDADRLRRAAADGTIEIADLVVAVHKPDGRVVLDQSVDMVTGGEVGSAFWGSFAGLVFRHPLTGTTLGSAAGAMGGWLADYGIDEAFMRGLSMTAVPGRAVLFVLTERTNRDGILIRLGEDHGEVLDSALDADADVLVAQALAEAERRRLAMLSEGSVA